jgi:hemerythrin-like domain-containing protein
MRGHNPRHEGDHMEAIEVLMQEHRTIEQVLDALEGFAEEVVRARRTDKEELSRFVKFLREFADGRHHAKEEGVLFEAMVEHGFPSEGGPIPVMLADHEHGRALIRVLADRAEQAGPWLDEDLGSLAEAARGYAALLRVHIQKEDRILYPMAERHLPDEALDEVSARCLALDAKCGPPEQDPHLALAEALGASHGPAARAPRTA